MSDTKPEYKHRKCDKAIIDNRPEDACDGCKSAMYSITAKVNAELNRRKETV